MEELGRRPRLFYSHICGAPIKGATDYHCHMDAHKAVTLRYLCEREGCKAAFCQERASDFVGHLKKRHGVTMTTKR